MTLWISDVQMPGMNGIELQSKLIVQGYRLAIIFVTAFSETRARAQALAAGASGFLAKPFSDEELITCLNEALAEIHSRFANRLRGIRLRDKVLHGVVSYPTLQRQMIRG